MKPLKTLALTLTACTAALWLFSSCGKPHTIAAEFKGLGNDTVLIQYLPLNLSVVPVMDTLVARNGKFDYDIPDSIDVQVYIQFPKQAVVLPGGRKFQSLQQLVFLVVRPGEQLRVKGSLEGSDYTRYTVEGGSPFNREYASVRDTYKAQAVEADRLEAVIDAEMLKPDSEERNAAMEQYNRRRGELYDRIREITVRYVEEHPASDLSAYFLTNNMALADFGTYYALLSDEVKTGVFAQKLTEREARWNAYRELMQAKENMKKGAPAPDFTLKSLDGKEVSLSSLKGKPVVLDFWGSWCSWCIKGAPAMVDSHKKYGKQVRFVGIACYDTDANWRKAVSYNKLEWLQLFNGTDGNDLTKKYAIEGYPTKIILDEELRIVEIFIGESEDFYKSVAKIAK